MYRKIDDHRYTASVNETGFVVEMYDEGWEKLVASNTQHNSKADALAWLAGRGYEEYDPNASLKAMGLVWNGYCYARPAGA